MTDIATAMTRIWRRGNAEIGEIETARSGGRAS
jgi:hypothetical protein